MGLQRVRHNLVATHTHTHTHTHTCAYTHTHTHTHTSYQSYKPQKAGAQVCGYTQAFLFDNLPFANRVINCISLNGIQNITLVFSKTKNAPAYGLGGRRYLRL